jgi:NAD(P)-dependent dehydrogenase (short-subunit alcohol dehydrogenase family)
VYARALAAEGARLAICDLQDPASVREEIAATGAEAISAAVDIVDAPSVAAFVEQVERAFGPVDVLVNNAALFGVLKKRPFTEIPAEEWDRVMAVNTRGVVEFVKAVVPGMKARKSGKIINIASTTVLSGTPSLMHYVASKGAVIAMTRVMARELGDFNIAVNCLAPGLTMSEAVKETADPTTVAGVLRARSFKREQEPEDLVGPLLFLATSDSNFVTGQTLVVDGGSFMH